MLMNEQGESLKDWLEEWVKLNMNRENLECDRICEQNQIWACTARWDVGNDNDKWRKNLRNGEHNTINVLTNKGRRFEIS